MRVEPEMVDHPKFMRLKRHIGDGAAEVLLRLWGHCQNSQRGGRWRNADAIYAECVARWSGKPGELFKALVEAGFVEKRPDSLVIHDWDTFNWYAVSAWKNGKKGGRPRVNQKATSTTPGKLEVNPLVNQMKTGCKPESVVVSEVLSEVLREEDGPPFPEQVSDEMVLAWAATWPGEPASGAPKMPVVFVNGWLKRMNGRTMGWPAQWQRSLVADWRLAFGNWGELRKKNAPRERWQVEKDLENARTLLAEHRFGSWPANKDMPPSVKEEWEKLKKQLADLKSELKKV